MKISFSSYVILLFGLSTASQAFCPDGSYLHLNETAGYACYREDEEELLCDSNLNTLCTMENCLVQLGGYESYNCGHASHYFDIIGASQELIDAWSDKCCFVEPAASFGCLADKEITFSGKCTYENFLAAAVENGCNEQSLLSYLDTTNTTESREKVAELCVDATAEAREQPYKFGDIAKGGYQFDREFMNGGSEWNNAFKPDLSRVEWTEDNIMATKAIEFPEYLQNFKPEKCTSKAVTCCWTADSSNAGAGSCTNPAGCQDGEPVDNTDVCHVDIENSYRASHTEDGSVFYRGDAEGSVNCMGFTWTDGEDDPANLYKGNLLFEVAMRYGLKDNGYTRSVPHAPMCACVEQMPVVSKADCKGVENVDNWSFAPDSESGLIDLWHAQSNLTFTDCGGQDLATAYESIHSSSISDYITGECETSEASFLEHEGYAVQDTVEWVKVAGKGSYAAPDDPKMKEQFLEGSHTSYSREDFEALWANSNNILMRQCKYCASTHRFAYIKRYDESLPPNVDLLNIVKDGWKQFENNTAGVDFDIFSTYDDALQEQNKWQKINSDYYNIGFARDSGPLDFTSNQWNVWESPLANKHYGQSSVAFYVAMPGSNVAES